jgi:hypothetical protein
LHPSMTAADRITSNPACVHCGHVRRRSLGPRGLCWRCFEDTDIRKRYPVLTRPNFAGLGLESKHPLPPLATDAIPGTSLKLAVLEERAANGQQLWHPNDYVDYGRFC